MAADVKLGYNSKLYYSPDGVTYTELPDLERLGPPDDGNLEVVEITPLSPTNRRKEYIAALIDSGSFTFQQFWNKTRYSLLRTYYSGGTNVYWRYVFPDNATPANASKLEFVGPLDQWRPSGAERTAKILIDGKVRITGDITFTAGA